MKFLDVIHAFKPNPKSHIQEKWRIVVFLSYHPESLHTFAFFYDDIVVPQDYMHMDGSSVHTFTLLNRVGHAIFVKFHWRPTRGVKNLLEEEAIIKVDEKPHVVFKRDGNDLVLHKRISPFDALIGKTIKLTTLDGGNLGILIKDVVKPGHEEVILDEGMSILKEPGKTGNLKIKFDIKFPSRLTMDQRSDLRRVLGDS